MAVKVQCSNPACGQSFSVAAEKLGHKARCPRCGEVFILSVDGARESVASPAKPTVETPAAKEKHTAAGRP